MVMRGDVLYTIIYEELSGPSLLVCCVKMRNGVNRLRLLAQDPSSFTSQCNSGPIAQHSSFWLCECHALNSLTKGLKRAFVPQSQN